MELDELLLKYNIRQKSLECYNEYMNNYKKEEPDDYDELFQFKKMEEVHVKIHSFGYVINCYFDNEVRYLATTIRLIYGDLEFAEYKVFFNLFGELEDDYLIVI